MAEEKEDHARDQARLQLESIERMTAALEHAEECGEDDTCREGCAEGCEHLGEGQHDTAHGCEHELYHNSETARERITEDALEVATGKDFDGTRTFMILLCTGGPAVRIVGELDEYAQPDRAWLEYQDWGTSWTEYHGSHETAALLSYAREFYFEE